MFEKLLKLSMQNWKCWCEKTTRNESIDVKFRSTFITCVDEVRQWSKFFIITMTHSIWRQTNFDNNFCELFEWSHVKIAWKKFCKHVIMLVIKKLLIIWSFIDVRQLILFKKILFYDCMQSSHSTQTLNRFYSNISSNRCMQFNVWKSRLHQFKNICVSLSCNQNIACNLVQIFVFIIQFHVVVIACNFLQ